MSDDVKALIAEARRYALSGEWKPATVLVARLADALESAQQAPAVDREALELVCVAEVERLAPNNQHAGDIGSSVASALLAFGVFQDAAQVEARGLEKAEKVCAEIEGEPAPGPGVTIAKLAIRGIAQRVREGN